MENLKTGHLEDRRRWEDTIKMNLKEIWYESVGWILVSLDRVQWRDLMNAVMNYRFH
jgi:hypothetical protein